MSTGSLVFLRNGDVRGALAVGLSFAFNFSIVSDESHITSVRSQITAEHIGRELAGSVRHGSGTSKVGVGSGQTLFVVQFSVGGRLGEQVRNQIGLGGRDDGESQGCSGDSSGDLNAVITELRGGHHLGASCAWLELADASLDQAGPALEKRKEA